LLHGNQETLSQKLSESCRVFEDVDLNLLEEKAGRFIFCA